MFETIFIDVTLSKVHSEKNEFTYWKCYDEKKKRIIKQATSAYTGQNIKHAILPKLGINYLKS